MKFTTETDKLKEVLQRLGFAVNDKSVLPAIRNILTTITNGNVLFTTTDLQVTINYGLECTTDGEGQFLIPFTHLKNILAVESGDVTVEFKKSLGTVVKFEHDEFNLGKSGKAEEFPKLAEVEISGDVQAGDDFIGALKTASLSVSKDELRPFMQCICIELQPDSITCTSTDGNGLYTQTISAEIKIQDKVELLVPPVVAKVLDGFESAKIGFNKGHMAFESGSMLVVATRVDGNYPGWRAIMREHTVELSLPLGRLRDAVAKSYVLSDSTNRGIDFFMSGSTLEVVSKHDDTAMGARCKMEAEIKTDVPQMRFNGRLLKCLLQQLEVHSNDDTLIQFSIQAATKAALVTVEGKANSVMTFIAPITIN